MTLTAMATATYSTKRPPSIASNKRGVPATHLQNVKCTPIMPLDPMPKFKDGLQGQVLEVWELYTEKHSHTDNSVVVDQLPDIAEGDFVVVGSVEYKVAAVAEWPATDGTTTYLQVIMAEPKG